MLKENYIAPLLDLMPANETIPGSRILENLLLTVIGQECPNAIMHGSRARQILAGCAPQTLIAAEYQVLTELIDLVNSHRPSKKEYEKRTQDWLNFGWREIGNVEIKLDATENLPQISTLIDQFTIAIRTFNQQLDGEFLEVERIKNTVQVRFPSKIKVITWTAAFDDKVPDLAPHLGRVIEIQTQILPAQKPTIFRISKKVPNDTRVGPFANLGQRMGKAMTGQGVDTRTNAKIVGHTLPEGGLPTSSEWRAEITRLKIELNQTDSIDKIVRQNHDLCVVIAASLGRALLEFSRGSSWPAGTQLKNISNLLAQVLPSPEFPVAAKTRLQFDMMTALIYRPQLIMRLASDHFVFDRLFPNMGAVAQIMRSAARDDLFNRMSATYFDQINTLPLGRRTRSVTTAVVGRLEMPLFSYAIDDGNEPSITEREHSFQLYVNNRAMPQQVMGPWLFSTLWLNILEASNSEFAAWWQTLSPFDQLCWLTEFEST